MAGPRVLNLVRPYRTEQEYLEHEGWTIERRSITLLGTPPLDIGEQIRFSIVLPNGHRVVRAEGQVMGPIEEVGGRPSGVRVRFRRFDLATKELVERLDLQRGSTETELTPNSIGADIPPSIVVAPPSSEMHPLGAARPTRADRTAAAQPTAQRLTSSRSDLDEPPKKSAPRTTLPPEMRDELLDRLRQRVKR